MEPQAVRDVLRRYPDLRMSYEEFLGLGAGVCGDASMPRPMVIRKQWRPA